MPKNEKKDYSIEAKLKNILDGDNYNIDQDEFNVTSYNFNGMIHEIITPKNYDKECINKLNSSQKFCRYS